MTTITLKTHAPRNGVEWRLYATDGGGWYPLHGAVFEDGKWRVENWTADGKIGAHSESDFDLIPRPPKPVERWMNWYLWRAHDTREQVDGGALANRTALVRVTQTPEGVPLSFEIVEVFK